MDIELLTAVTGNGSIIVAAATAPATAKPKPLQATTVSNETIQYKGIVHVEQYTSSQ